MLALSFVSLLSRSGLVTRTAHALLAFHSSTSSSGFQYTWDTWFQCRRLYSLQAGRHAGTRQVRFPCSGLDGLTRHCYLPEQASMVLQCRSPRHLRHPGIRGL